MVSGEELNEESINCEQFELPSLHCLLYFVRKIRGYLGEFILQFCASVFFFLFKAKDSHETWHISLPQVCNSSIRIKVLVLSRY